MEHYSNIGDSTASIVIEHGARHVSEAARVTRMSKAVRGISGFKLQTTGRGLLRVWRLTFEILLQKLFKDNLL